jgi:centromere/kinetochore protein ZW10
LKLNQKKKKKMESGATEQHLGQAVLRFASDGTYPDTEDVISANITASALPVVLQHLEQAREEVKVLHRFKNAQN